MRHATALLLSATLSSACAGSVEQARRYAARGDQHFAADRFDAAVIEYRNALKQQPKSADTHLKLADTYTALDKAEEAYREYASAIELRPGNTRSYLGMGRLLLDAGMYNEARLRAELILDREPRNVDALLLYGRALNRQAGSPTPLAPSTPRSPSIRARRCTTVSARQRQDWAI